MRSSNKLIECSFLIKFFSFRSAAVDSTGHEFNRNRLIALMSAIVLEEVRFSCSAVSRTVMVIFEPWLIISFS